MPRAGACESPPEAQFYLQHPAADKPFLSSLLPKPFHTSLWLSGALLLLLGRVLLELSLSLFLGTLWPSQELLKLNSGRHGEQESKEREAKSMRVCLVSSRSRGQAAADKVSLDTRVARWQERVTGGWALLGRRTQVKLPRFHSHVPLVLRIQTSGLKMTL